MNPIHVHLALTHVPIIGTFIGFLILMAGLLFRNQSLRIAAMGIIIFTTLISIPVFKSGDASEHKVEKFAGVSKDDIETHEDMAKIYFKIQMALLIVTALTLIAHLLKWEMAKYAIWVVAFVTLSSVLFSYYVGNTGGSIRHPEINNQTQADSSITP
ncbi:MAG: hypothetical protein LC101_01370 [Flavobacteriales bacterium]|nr:hypothetical protein [Flavobacteriales bacterium]